MFIGDYFPSAHAGVRDQHDLWLGIVDAGGEGVGGEPAKDNGMDRAEPDGGEHGEDGFGNHGHVDQHAVALAHAKALQHGGHRVALRCAVRGRYRPSPGRLPWRRK